VWFCVGGGMNNLSIRCRISMVTCWEWAKWNYTTVYVWWRNKI